MLRDNRGMTNTTTQTAFVPDSSGGESVGRSRKLASRRARGGACLTFCAGRRLLADPEAVRETLAFRASTDSGKGVSHAD